MSEQVTKHKKPTKVFLDASTDHADHKFLNIAPTMKRIVYEGRTYHRSQGATALDESDGEWGQLYLWDGWVDWFKKKNEIE